MPNLEDVFRSSGVPTYTFIKPERYSEILVSVRTPGRGLILEGPSGIGKTTTITQVLNDLGLTDVLFLSARKSADAELIAALPEMHDIGPVIVDDFHRLDDSIKARLSDFMKILADSESQKSKLILIGINKAGHQLVKFAHDLGLRVDVFKLEANPTEKIEEVMRRGEAALNVSFSNLAEIAERAQGSFQLIQLLCHKLCVLRGVTETQKDKKEITTSINVAVEDVMGDLSRQFKDAAVSFARGSKLRPAGRAPYLHILRWLAESDDWSIDLSEEIIAHPELKGSVGQVMEKGYLQALINDPDKNLSALFHYEPSTTTLSVEDPKLSFYLKNVIWRVFTRQVGYKANYFRSKWDFALSFAGTNRGIAKALADSLTEHEVHCFYDFNEQHRIIAQNVEDYLAPIYRSEAAYVLALLSPDYPQRIWTKFESDHFRERFGAGAVIPIRFTNVNAGFFSDDMKYGGLSFDPFADHAPQLDYIVEILCKRLAEDRQREAADAAAESEATD